MRILPVFLAAVILTVPIATHAQDCDVLNWGRCNAVGTEQKPLVVKQVPSEPNHDKEDNERQLVLATWGLVVVTLGLAIVTGLLFRTTRTAALAAKESAEALPKLERAYLFETVSFISDIDSITRQLTLKEEDQELVDEPWNPKEKTFFALFSVRLVNHGKTPAIIKSVVLGADHFNNNDEPTSYRQKLVTA